MQKNTVVGIWHLGKELEAIRGRGSQCLDISQGFKRKKEKKQIYKLKRPRTWNYGTVSFFKKLIFYGNKKQNEMWTTH